MICVYRNNYPVRLSHDIWSKEDEELFFPEIEVIHNPNQYLLTKVNIKCY